MRKSGKYMLIFLLLMSAQESIAQFTNPMLSGMDTLYMPADSMALSIDPDPANNPFLNNSAGTLRATDDPGGPGSGGGGGATNPPDDIIIPLDGGVGVLVIAGAILGIRRRRKPVLSNEPLS